jgi:hypothetical protein
MFGEASVALLQTCKDRIWKAQSHAVTGTAWHLCGQEQHGADHCTRMPSWASSALARAASSGSGWNGSGSGGGSPRS